MNRKGSTLATDKCEEARTVSSIVRPESTIAPIELFLWAFVLPIEQCTPHCDLWKVFFA